jgi:hypothetical protein
MPHYITADACSGYTSRVLDEPLKNVLGSFLGWCRALVEDEVRIQFSMVGLDVVGIAWDVDGEALGLDSLEQIHPTDERAVPRPRLPLDTLQTWNGADIIQVDEHFRTVVMHQTGPEMSGFLSQRGESPAPEMFGTD